MKNCKLCNCDSDIICEICQKSIHLKCDKVPQDLIDAFSSIPTDTYYCCKCTEEETNRKDLLNLLFRLHFVKKLQKRKFRILFQILNSRLKEMTFPDKVFYDSSTEIDEAQLELMKACDHETIKKLFHNPIPLKSSGDGLCLYNSVSTLVWGDESHAYELKYRSILDLYLNCELHKVVADKTGMTVLEIEVMKKQSVFEHMFDSDYADPNNIRALANIMNRTLVILTNQAYDPQTEDFIHYLSFNQSYRPLKEDVNFDTTDNTLCVLFTKHPKYKSLYYYPPRPTSWP